MAKFSAVSICASPLAPHSAAAPPVRQLVYSAAPCGEWYTHSRFHHFSFSFLSLPLGEQRDENERRCRGARRRRAGADGAPPGALRQRQARRDRHRARRQPSLRRLCNGESSCAARAALRACPRMLPCVVVRQRWRRSPARADHRGRARIHAFVACTRHRSILRAALISCAGGRSRHCVGRLLLRRECGRRHGVRRGRQVLRVPRLRVR